MAVEGKQRLDILLAKKGFFESRSRAQAAVMEGKVFVDGKKVNKAGIKFPFSAHIEIMEDEHSYVSRGGLKLEKAVEDFNINFKGKVVLDIGASTGGFTDCALQNGAHKVFAVDVGYGQLAWKLRTDARVVPLERTNARYLTLKELQQKVDVITIDVSFISLAKVLPVSQEVLAPNGELVVLIKPQFEAGRDKVGKKGVVRDPSVHEEVILGNLEFAEKLGVYLYGLTVSPVKGPQGNIEYLAYMIKGTKGEGYEPAQIKNIVTQAWSDFNPEP